jgi:hypothetical protein
MNLPSISDLSVYFPPRRHPSHQGIVRSGQENDTMQQKNEAQEDSGSWLEEYWDVDCGGYSSLIV